MKKRGGKAGETWVLRGDLRVNETICVHPGGTKPRRKDPTKRRLRVRALNDLGKTL